MTDRRCRPMPWISWQFPRKSEEICFDTVEQLLHIAGIKIRASDASLEQRVTNYHEIIKNEANAANRMSAG